MTSDINDINICSRLMAVRSEAIQDNIYSIVCGVFRGGGVGYHYPLKCGHLLICATWSDFVLVKVKFYTLHI